MVFHTSHVTVFISSRNNILGHVADQKDVQNFSRSTPAENVLFERLRTRRKGIAAKMGRKEAACEVGLYIYFVSQNETGRQRERDI